MPLGSPVSMQGREVSGVGGRGALGPLWTSALREEWIHSSYELRNQLLPVVPTGKPRPESGVGPGGSVKALRLERRGRGSRGVLLGTGEPGWPGQPFPSAFQLLHLTRRLLGQRLFEKLMKMTFYGQFVAGEDQESIRPVIQHNRAFGVGSILDYGVEEDLSPEEAERKEME